MTNLVENLVQGKEYSIKLTYKGRKAKYQFEGYTKSYHTLTEYTEVMQFRSNSSGNIYVTTEHIESIEEVKEKTKNKKVTCPKCAGEKYFKQYTSIRGGVCFTCEGNGFILK